MVDFTKFQHPDTFLRPAPFWSVNGRLTPEECARQMRDMLDNGFSGGYFHSRAGLITEYLGEEWFAAMEAVLQVVRERGGYLWLYDEDQWPSGNAGGKVVALNEEYAIAFLRAELVAPGELPAEIPGGAVRSAYRLKRDVVQLLELEQIPFATAQADIASERLIIRRFFGNPSNTWGGRPAVSLLHPEVTREFIRLTHEVYYARFGEEFGKYIPGIFTDEPELPWGSWWPDEVPWYEGMPAVYTELTGRDWWADLPYLFFDGPEHRRIRLLIHRALVHQFCEAFSKPLYQWCEAHGLAFTGHYQYEDNFGGLLRCHWGNVMAHYRYQHIPGIDHLTRKTKEMLFTAKQCTSVARQYGRKHVLSEIFGVSRTSSTFEDIKRVGDFDLALGVTLFCPHLSWYTMLGRRKRDCPQNFNYQQTYWHEMKALNDYFTRLAAALSEGKPVVDVLLLHSMEGTTAGHRIGIRQPEGIFREEDSLVQNGDRTMRHALEAILNAGYECDLGDEWAIEDNGCVDGAQFRIGEMAYRVVVVPPSQTWRPCTFALLREFVHNGGTLIFLGETPGEIDALPARAEWQALIDRAVAIPCSRPQIVQALDRLAPRTYLLRDADGRAAEATYVHHRVDGDQHSLFITNTDADRAQEYDLTLCNAAGTPLASWNALDGTRTVITPKTTGADARYRFILPPGGSVLLVSGPDAAADALPAQPLPALSRGEIIPLPSAWSFTRSEENVLVLDRFSASVDGGETWFEEDIDRRIRRKLTEYFGMTAALDTQPWVLLQDGRFDHVHGEVSLRYRFTSTLDRPHASLVIEQITKGQVHVNGTPVDLANAGWHWDHEFGKVEISDLIIKGENLVEFRVPFDVLTEIEPAYIIGDFGVRLATPASAEIIAEPTELQNGSWVTQGYPFYSGCMTYRTSITAETGRIFLRLRNGAGTLFMVRLNGQPAGDILWRPHLLELTPFLQPGENTLEVEVVSSRMNTHGPIHERDGEMNIYENFEFEPMLRAEYSLFDYGLLNGAELVVIRE